MGKQLQHMFSDTVRTEYYPLTGYYRRVHTHDECGAYSSCEESNVIWYCLVWGDYKCSVGAASRLCNSVSERQIRSFFKQKTRRRLLREANKTNRHRYEDLEYGRDKDRNV